MSNEVGNQQAALYDAERFVSMGRVFTSLAEIQAYVDALRDTWWWSYFYWKVGYVEVGPARRGGRDGSVGWYDHDKDAGRMEMAPVHWNEQTVTHELTHVVVDALGTPERGHGPFFARTYANLTFLISGSDRWLQLQAAFDKRKIEYMQ